MVLTEESLYEHKQKKRKKRPVYRVKGPLRTIKRDVKKGMKPLKTKKNKKTRKNKTQKT